MDLNLNSIIFNVAYIKLYTKSEGPYNRCCIWFQGCNINCRGCCNKDLQPLVPSHILTLNQLVNIIKKAKDEFNLEGITLSGGEPSLQNGLIYLNKEIHKLGLGIIMFSGKNKSLLNKELVDSVDLLIDSPFIVEKIDRERILLGSKNKRLIFITNRYKKDRKYFENKISLEEVTAEDYIFINGD